MKVLKFGGTSMANAASIRQVAEIVRGDKQAKFVVVSAPGKREKTDTKVTDLLYACYDQKRKEGVCDAALLTVRQRFDDIIAGLGLTLDLSDYFAVIRNDINSGASKDYVASRGEYLSAVVTAAYLGYAFIDARELIRFDMNGNFDAELTNSVCAKRLANSAGVVVPGFYGEMPNRQIKTFSRGGSDVTGAILARAVGAEVYENWTDVDGFMTCDPRIVENPHVIGMITYKELRELSYMGANVLHPDSIFPVRKSDIPIHIRNTFNPSAQGTRIVPTKHFLAGDYMREIHTITGIAGKTDFCALHVEKSMMNAELGFVRKFLSILERHGILVEHIPSGIDTMSVIIDRTGIDDNTLAVILEQIRAELHPDCLDVIEGLALIAVVGHGMSRKPGTASRVCMALSNAGINIRMIDQGSSELNIIIAVENADYEAAIGAIYAEFENN